MSTNSPPRISIAPRTCSARMSKPRLICNLGGSVRSDGPSSRVFFRPRCYVLAVMAALRTRSAKLALWLALILPLQSFASVWSCQFLDAASPPAQHSCGQHQPLHADGLQHHHCGTCCAAAIAVTPLRFTPPRPLNLGAALPLRWPPPKIALDRLDRPPRFV